jgi:serine/threonine protein phosphatase PrpC
MVEDAAIAACLARGEASQKAAQDLLDLALENGGRDNVTIIVAGYSMPRLEAGVAPRREPPSNSLEPTDEFPVHDGPPGHP